MKRDGHIIEEITEWSNLEASFDSVVCGTLRKTLTEGKWLLEHRESFLADVKREIESGHVNIAGYHEKTIVEGGKTRHIQVFNMRDRIKVNAVMTVVDRHLHRRFIRTTSASIKNRGMHDLKAYIERDIAENPNLQYVYKCDVRKFYDTVNQDMVMRAVRHVFKDARLIHIIEQFVRLLPGDTGISIGLRTSQGVGNLLLSVFLDHIIKDTMRIRYYYRYCDDIVVLAETKPELWQIQRTIHERITAIGQTIKPNERIFPIRDGIDFLGYVIRPTHTRLRKRVKRHLCGQLSRVKSRKRRTKLIAAFYGMAKHAATKQLLRTYLTPNEMRKYAELGVKKYTPSDGKKRFHGKQVRIPVLVNKEIEIHDFERDVQTPNGLRYLVSFHDPIENYDGKFFTNSDEMKSDLEDIASKQDGFPFETTIRSEPFANGRGFRYYFS
jgi:hypothetical protein